MREINTIYRITDWLPYLGFALMGLALKISPVDIINLDFFLSVLILPSLLLSYAYSLNDYFDEGKKKKYFLLPLVFSAASLPFLNFGQILLGAMFLILVTLYSFKGISLMKFPIVSTLANSAGFMLIFAIGYAVEAGVTILGLVFFLLLTIYETVAQFIHEKVHLEIDIAAGRRTSVFYLGEKLVLLLRVMLLLTFPLALFLLFKTEFILFAIACMLFSLMFFIKAGEIDKNLRKRYKLAGTVVGLFFLLDYFFNVSSVL